MTPMLFLWLIGWAITCGAEPSWNFDSLNASESAEQEIKWMTSRFVLMFWWPFRLGRLMRRK